MHRSEITIDLGAVRRNVRRLRSVLGRSQLWAVVKADGYGHGAVDVAGAALREGALALCVATVAEALPLRREFQGVRILVLGPSTDRDVAQARDANLDLAVFDEPIPEGVRVHLKLDTGMGRWGLSELPAPPVNVVGLMSHLAMADSSPVRARPRRWRPASSCRFRSSSRPASGSRSTPVRASISPGPSAPAVPTRRVKRGSGRSAWPTRPSSAASTSPRSSREQAVRPDDYACCLVEGVAEHADEIDALLRKYSEHWALERMPVVDRTLLRLVDLRARLGRSKCRRPR